MTRIMNRTPVTKCHILHVFLATPKNVVKLLPFPSDKKNSAMLVTMIDTKRIPNNKSVILFNLTNILVLSVSTYKNLMMKRNPKLLTD